MKRVPATFLRAVQAHRNRLERVLTVRNVANAKQLYEDAQASLQARIRRTLGAGRGDTFTAHQQRIMLTQLRQGQSLIGQRMAGNLNGLTKVAQETSMRGLVDDVSRLNKFFTGSELTLPVEEAAVFRGLIDRRATSMLVQQQASMARYGAHLVDEVQKKLSVAVLTQEPVHEVYDDVAAAIDKEWYWGERIVRTETAYAYNVTHRDGISESAKEIPELMQQWQEHCDDDGSPLDERVGVDSIAMHGQVAPAGGLFTMPSTAPHGDAKGKREVPASLVGLQWAFPPNRPNDRAVLSPWMPDWGVPGWRWLGGRRVPM